MFEEEEEINISSSNDLIKNILKLPKVSTLSLSRSSLIHIPQIIFYLPKLQKLDLSSNPIQELDGLWDGNLFSLKELNLSACWLEKLPIGAPTFSASLQTFLLDGNFLYKNPPNFTVFTHLKTLSLIGNDLTEIPPLPQTIEKLYFRMNSFSSIPHYPQLTLLDCSYGTVPNSLKISTNVISTLDLSHGSLFGDIRFPPMPLLTSINLSNNSIAFLSFESSRRLSFVDLSFNSFSEFPSFVFNLPMLRTLYLSHNAISSIPCDLSVLRRLEIFDISHNSLITGKINLPPRLKSLRASFNFSISFAQFPPSLQEFDASFCSFVAIPPVAQPLRSFAVYFVTTIGFSEHMKPLTYQLNDSEEDENCTAIAPFSMFNLENYHQLHGPSIDAHTMINESLADKVGCSATSGRSTKYEDNFLCFTHDGVLFVGVFDGHAGHESAFIAADTFSKILGNIIPPLFVSGDRHALKDGMRNAFALVNDELNRRLVKDGTTAVIVCIKDNLALVAHLGDSLALLVNKQNNKFITKQHRPTNREEYASLKRQNKNVSSDWRVDGKLCVSRSLGDFWCCGGMYDSPDLSIIDMNEENLSIVLACDGLWDYVDEGSVCNVVRSIRDPVKSSKLLQDIAFASGSHDSISVIVINVDK